MTLSKQVKDNSLMLNEATFVFTQKDRGDGFEMLSVKLVDEGGGFFIQISTPDKSIWTINDASELKEILDKAQSTVDNFCKDGEK